MFFDPGLHSVTCLVDVYLLTILAIDFMENSCSQDDFLSALSFGFFKIEPIVIVGLCVIFIPCLLNVVPIVSDTPWM